MITRFRGGIVRLGLRVDRGTFIFDISNISVVVISSVGHSLDTTIGKSNLVRSGNGFAISGLLGVEFGAGVVIGNTVLESVGFGGFVVMGRSRCVVRGRDRGVIGSWGSSGKSHGDSHEGSEGSNAKHDKLINKIRFTS